MCYTIASVIVLAVVAVTEMYDTDPAPAQAPLYECLDCGERVEDPDGRLCACGGYLQNISVPRPQ